MKNNTEELNSKEELLKQWFGLKCRIHNKSRSRHFREGEVWWCSFGENIGVEINGKHASFDRPVVILKKLSSYSFMGVPLTSQYHSGSWYVNFQFREKQSYANLSQSKTLSAKRLNDRMGELSNGDLRRIRTGFIKLYGDAK